MKLILKKSVAILLTLCIVFSMVSTGAPAVRAAEYNAPVVAGVGGFLAEFVGEKLLETGMRVLCEGTEMLAEATGNEKIEEGISFINKWVLMDAAEAAAVKTQELCEEILNKLDELEEEVNEYSAEIESLIGHSTQANSLDALEQRWASDVTNVMETNAYSVTQPLEEYHKYMQMALDLSNGVNGVTQEKLDEQSEALIMSFLSMYSGGGDVENLAPDKFKETIFVTDVCINANFNTIINSLSSRLVASSTASTTVAERAAIAANDAYPFSHEQYQFVSTVIYEQFMNILHVEMLYNEFLSLQGEYIKNHKDYGVDSAKWDGYVTLRDNFMTQMDTVTQRMAQMLEAEMRVSDSVSLTLNDYMKPEDAASTLMNIDGFQNRYVAPGAISETIGYAKYSASRMQYNRVMANGTVYYILNPAQFSDPLAMSAWALDHKYSRFALPDVHYTSCDYINYIKKTSDGVNTFQVPGDASPYGNLFNTNAFNLADRVPAEYLRRYLPDRDGSATTYLITPGYKNTDEGGKLFETVYADYMVINGNSPAAGSVPDVVEISGEVMQDEKGQRDRFTAVLVNQSGVYQQKAHVKTNGRGVEDVKLVATDAKGNQIVLGQGDSGLIPSGQMISISFKLAEGFTLDDLKLVRNNDLYNNSAAYRTETVLMGGSVDYGMMQVDENGYCSFDYPMPYSDATFELSAVKAEPYYISNAEELMAFAAEVNDDCPNINAVVVADIDMKGYAWTPIAADLEYEGDFDGGNHRIYNLGTPTHHYATGLFGNSRGTIRNLTVEGNFHYDKNAENVGGVVGRVTGGKLTNVTSGVFIQTTFDTKAELRHIGGVVGSLENGTLEQCTFRGKVDISNSNDSLGGVVGYAGGGATISNCADLGDVITRKGGAFTGGILGYLNNTTTSIRNCYSASSPQCMNADSSGFGPVDYTRCGAIIGYAKNVDPNKITNNYFLTSPFTYKVLPYGTDSRVAFTASEMSRWQFESGEVAYQLNRSVTDGSQVWYQNLDNGQTVDAYPTFAGGTVYYGINCKQNAIYSNYPLTMDGSHVFTEKGFCKVCDMYQPAVKNSDGIYEISNVGQMFWFASLVNGDRTHAEFESKLSDAKGLLTRDIDLAGYDWKPIRNYSGTFDGNGRTISNMLIIATESYSGLFGDVSGSVIDVTVTGDIIPVQSVERIGGIAGYFKGGRISGCTSYVNVSMYPDDHTSIVCHLGGVVGSFYGGVVENCLSYSEITINAPSNDCFGGVVGYAGGDGTVINNCAYLGTIKTLRDDAFTGGILGYVNDGDVSVTNCYNFGTVSCAGDGQQSYVRCGAIIGWLRRADINKIQNNYYNSDTTANPFGTESASGFPAQAMTAQQFQSGEVAYKLNNGITDGTQVWYQNLDNGGTNYGYPLFDGGTVYKLPGGTYSNTDRSVDAFDRDENGDLLIKTYEDLVKLAELVRSDYDLYGSESYALANNIFAPKDSVWSMGIGSVAENKPFNGTFHGKVHIIAGLNVACDTYGGLFEIIGQSGSVDNLFLVDCDYADTGCDYAGGIAAINEGTISECMSGLILSGEIVFTNPNTQEQITAKDYNSAIRGKNAGGMVAVNYGRIEFSRNASVVTGTENVGGIAAMNVGSIYGCSNTAPIGDSTAKVSGGLVGTNNGTLESGYSSGKVKGKTSGSFGAIAGVNNSEEVHNIFYVVINNVDALGKSSTILLGSDNIKKSGASAMREDAFTAELNAVTEGKEWVRDDDHNQGFPAIDSKYFDIQLKKSADGITVSGVMHQNLQISYQRCGQNSQIYQQLSQHAIGNLFAVYEAAVTDGKRIEIPYELWSRGGVQITLPSDKIIGVTGIAADGSVVKLEISTADGKTLFSAAEPFAYLVVSEQDSISESPDDPGNAGTGDTSYTILLSIIAVTAALGLTLLFTLDKRSKKHG